MLKTRTIILIFFVFWFCVRLCYELLNILLLNKRVKFFGTKIYTLPTLSEDKVKMFYLVVISCSITIICSLVIVIISGELLLLIFIIFPATILLRSFSVKILSKQNGIYEKGIIIGTFIKYYKI